MIGRWVDKKKMKERKIRKEGRKEGMKVERKEGRKGGFRKTRLGQ